MGEMLVLDESFYGVLCEKLFKDDGCDIGRGTFREVGLYVVQEMLDLDMIQVYFRQAYSRIQESLNLLQLPSPDEGLVLL